jgi:hypothetical protein
MNFQKNSTAFIFQVSQPTAKTKKVMEKTVFLLTIQYNTTVQSRMLDAHNW